MGGPAMKSLLIASLLLSPLAASPAFAASIDDHAATAQHRLGAFAGARFRVAMGGEQAGQPRLGVTMTGVDYRLSGDGRMRARFADGAEYGFSADGLQLSFAGEPFRTRKEKLNASGGGGISPDLIIGAGIAVVVIGAAVGIIDAVGDD